MNVATSRFESLANELVSAVDRAALELRKIDDVIAGVKAKPDQWSVKEIVGHLIDSAANNHQRVVRAQLSGELSFPGYEQTAWVALQDYQSRPWRNSSTCGFSTITTWRT